MVKVTMMVTMMVMVMVMVMVMTNDDDYDEDEHLDSGCTSWWRFAMGIWPLCTLEHVT